ncbi:FimV/HubP family polar landmark protein [Aliivibrio fischeri]|uniref:FimV/HubP family polar landmark protein n=1 Tax=Aliivibrio fischeri TaxID=668 RepID=UPI0007C53A10|nr:FimV/HubP family polar landmark protein [Aliivibrio fischeri]
MSDASQKIFKTLTPLALFVAAQCSQAQASTIQIVGPEGKDQTVSSQVVTEPQPAKVYTKSVPAEKAPQAKASTKIYGPTREDETLWSIASRVNPSNTTSVQQTLLAIYRLNPQAFENNNIHGLEPNSRLRLPTLEQVRRENTDDAKQLLLAHNKKLAAQKASEAQVKRTVKTEKPAPTPKPAVTPAKTEAKVQEQKPAKEVVKSVAEQNSTVVALKSELDTTEQEFTALQENNHQLRVRLAQVQNEVDNLKSELGDEDRIRNEVEKFINEQKQLAAAEKKVEPTAMDKLASSPGLIASLALIPGALIAGLIAFFLFRRKKEEEEGEGEAQAEQQPAPLVMPEDNFKMDDDIPEISLDDDDDILSDLNNDEFIFDEQSDSNDDLFAEFETDNDNTDEDPFAELESDSDLDSLSLEDESDLDLELGGLDDLDDDLDMSSSALTVGAEEKALGLEEMEKALNDFDSDLFSESDLEAEDDDFDLSLIDDSDSEKASSIPELEETEELEGGELDQSMLDDLFASVDDEDEDESVLDQGWDLDENEETKLVPETEEVEAKTDSLEDELDFDELLSGMADEESEKESDLEDELDLDSEDESTALLDELLDESDDETEDEFDLEDNSTALLDELIDESDEEQDDDLDIDADSTALLDELLDDEELDDEDDITLEEDSTALLDELLADDDEKNDNFELDEDSTALLDELIGDDADEENETLGKTGVDAEVDGVAASEALSEDTPRDEDWLIEDDEEDEDDIPLFESESEPENEHVSELDSEEDKITSETDLLESTEPQVQEDELAEPVSESDILKEFEEDDLDSLLADDESLLDLEEESVDLDALNEDEALNEESEDAFSFDEELESEIEETDVSKLAEPTEPEVMAEDVTEETVTPEVESTEALEEDDLDEATLDSLLAGDESLLDLDEESVDLEALNEDEALNENSEDEFSFDEELESEAEETEVSELAEPTELEVMAEDVTEETVTPEVESTEALEEDDLDEATLDSLLAGDESLLDLDEESVDLEVLNEDEALNEESKDAFSFDEELESEAEETEVSELEEPTESEVIAEDTVEEAVASDVESTEALEEDTLDEDDNDFSLDDFVEQNATDFSQKSEEESSVSELDLDSDEEEQDTKFDGLSIEDALAALGDDDNEIDDSAFNLDSTEEETEIAPSREEFNFTSQVSDEEKEALTHLDSAGLDIDSMLEDGGSDWSGFSLDGHSNTESALEDEDWSEQPNVENDPHGENRFLSIEALIAETEKGDKNDFEEEDLNLDVGLDEFPDMLGNVAEHDVDVNSDAQSKLDLAKAYIEMSDDKGALELLEDVLRSDDVSLKIEAEKLMKQIG